MACANLYVLLGVKPENIMMFDSKGVFTEDRTDLSALQQRYCKRIETVDYLDEAIKDADVFLGLSAGNYYDT